MQDFIADHSFFQKSKSDYPLAQKTLPLYLLNKVLIVYYVLGAMPWNGGSSAE